MEKYENGDGLLQNLPSWNFVEWSAANDWINDVNYPTNFLYAEVLRENTYLSRTVKVEEGQRVIDTGLYGIVRHPMYSATLLLFLSMPLMLGSVYAFAVFLIYPFLIAVRIKHEERLLEQELDGYREYKTRVRYRLIPWIW